MNISRQKPWTRPVAAVGGHGGPARGCGPSRGFSLLEVMVACAIFFMVAFALLELVTQSLSAAKAIQHRDPDPGIILAALSLSNAFEEVTMEGNFEDIAPGMYKNYRWVAELREIGTNGLWEIQVATYNERRKSQNPVSAVAQFFRPLSKPGSASKGGL
jgi:hypothetical protein